MTINGKQLIIYADTHKYRPYSWGHQLYAEATQRGLKAQLIRNFREHAIPACYFFARLEQASNMLQAAKCRVLRISELPQVRSIIHPREFEHYERKDLQALAFAEDMPDTRVIHSEHCALDLLSHKFWRIPFISKSAYGSSSSDVRLIRTRDEALREAHNAFTSGLKTKRGIQRGYLIWQELLEGNGYSYRAVVIGSYYWLLRVYNRPGTHFASGSGIYEACKPPLSNEEFTALTAAVQFFIKHNMSWCGIDLLFDSCTKYWNVLETTIAWNLRAKGANEACPVIDAQGKPHPMRYHGRDQWRLLLDEIESGIFG